MDIITKLYIGLNDKDTKKQEHNIESFKTVLDFILLEHGYEAYTVEQVQGSYKGDKEETLIVTLVNPKAGLSALCDDIKQSFNQECVMMKRYNASVQFI